MFTLEQIKEIAKKLQIFGIKNSQFKKVENILGTEEISVLQNNENKNLKISDFVEYIKNNIGGTIEPTECTLIVSSYPDNAIIKIDDVVRNTIKVKKGTSVKVEVEAVGYIKYSSLVTVNTNKELVIVLEKEVVKEKGTLTVTVTPSDAEVKINGIKRNSITEDFGTSVYVMVTKQGYKPYVDSIVITQKEQNLNVVLEEEIVINNYTFTINPTPLDAIIKIDGSIRNSIVVESGTTVNWEVSKEGYNTKTGKAVVTSNTTLDVELEKIVVPQEQVTFSINATPKDSIIKINNSVRNTITVDKGSTITWEVSKKGYVTQSGEEIVNIDTTKEVILSEIVVEKVQFTINPTPIDSKVVINSKTVNTVTIVKGESVTWEVSKEGYTTQRGTEVINVDTIKNVELKLIPSEWTEFTVGASPTTENPIESVPYIGGVFSLQAFVTENKKIKDVTSLVTWKITGEGCTNIRENVFEWSENTLTTTRRATITASVTDPLEHKLNAQVESIQEGKTIADTYLTVTPQNLIFEEKGGTKTLNIVSNTSWSIE